MDNSDHKIRASTDDEEELKRIFSKNLKLAMKEIGISSSELARELKVSRTAVHKWRIGENLPRSGMLQQMSHILHCGMMELITEDGLQHEPEGLPDSKDSLTEGITVIPAAKQGIPVYDSVSCGKGSFVDEDIIDTLKLPEEWLNSSSSYFANKAKGDSMEPLIQNGDYLIFQKADVVPIGEIGAFSLNGEYFCKRLKRYNDGSLWLISDNSDYAPIPVKRDDDFRYLGKFSFKLLKVTQ